MHSFIAAVLREVMQSDWGTVSCLMIVWWMIRMSSSTFFWKRDGQTELLLEDLAVLKILSEKDNCISANLSSSSQISALFCTNSLIKSFLWSPVSRGNKSPAFSEQSLNSLISNKATGKVLFSRLSQRTKLILRA